MFGEDGEVQREGDFNFIAFAVVHMPLLLISTDDAGNLRMLGGFTERGEYLQLVQMLRYAWEVHAGNGGWVQLTDSALQTDVQLDAIDDGFQRAWATR